MKKLAEKGVFLHSATRKNMNRVISEYEFKNLCRRNIIETNWGVLKQNYFLEYHQARNMTGLMRHYISAILAFLIERFKINRNQTYIDFGYLFIKTRI